MPSVDVVHSSSTHSAAPDVGADTLTQLLAPLRLEFEALNQCIDAALHSDIALIQQIARHLIEAGGKRLRPALLLLVVRALSTEELDATIRPEHISMAAVIEFIHTATLLHDDVVDESCLRRGRQTANALFGNAASVLVGDFLYSRAFQLMVQLQSTSVMRIMADATNVIAEGEVLQLLNIGDVAIDEARYLQVVRFKTARLFEAAAQVAAVLVGANAALEEAATALGRHLGSAFQLIDDVLDYTGLAQDIGKNVGDDLREGKLTLPLIRALRVAPPAGQALLRQVISEPDRVSETAFTAVVAVIRETDALEYTRALAQSEIQQAQRALSEFPESAAKQTLLHFCDFAVRRRC